MHEACMTSLQASSATRLTTCRAPTANATSITPASTYKRRARSARWCSSLHAVQSRLAEKSQCGRYNHRSPVLCCATDHAQTGFHQKRLAATHLNTKDRQPNLTVNVREAQGTDELKAVGWLRARSFYAYPPERAFAGQIHQAMIAEEEYKALKTEQDRRGQERQDSSQERAVCLLAVQHPGTAGSQEQSLQAIATPELQTGNGGSSRRDSRKLSDDHARPDVLGTLDLYAVRALHGEVLIGNSDNAAYLANVCVADQARRRGVGKALVQAARCRARQWGVSALYVHIMAVNGAAAKFYELQGFMCEQEESSNQAHYRGHCLDGIEGRGRTMLLRDTLLWD